MRRGGLLLLGAALAAAACVERVTAPGTCPAYCPGRQLVLVDTLLTGLSRDSAFLGYVLPNQAPYMLVASLPGVDSRAIFRFARYGPRWPIKTSDTTTGPIVAADSGRLLFFITRRDSLAANLTVRLYRMPVTIDTTTTFADLSGPFTDSLLRTVNIDSLLALSNHRDSITGDSVAPDTANHRIAVSLKLDSAQMRYVLADTGKVAYGIRISADSLASVALGKSGLGPVLTPYVFVDSLGDTVVKKLTNVGTTLTTFVFDPPQAPLDSTLAVGGVPATRSFIRVAVPRVIRDSARIMRATLLLVPAVAAQGAPTDSFLLDVRGVLSDFGAKSPLTAGSAPDTASVLVGSTDTVHVEVTDLFRAWQLDTTRATTLALRARIEGASFAQIRFHPSLAAAYRPAIRITYVAPYAFGKP